MYKNGVSTKTESTFERIKFQNLQGKRPESGKTRMNKDWDEDKPVFYAGAMS